MEQMIVKIKDGKIQIEIGGVRGTRCLDLTQAIEQLIGEVETRSLRHEFYYNTRVKQNILIQNKFDKLDNFGN